MAKSEFELKVEEAREIYAQLTEQVKLGDARDEKLSARGYLEEALRIGNTTVAKLRDLHKRLQPLDQHPWIASFVSEVQRRAEAVRLEDGCTLRPPTANFHTLLGRGGAPATQLVNVTAEAMQYGTTVSELVALGSWLAVENAPESFGAVDDWGAHAVRLEQLQRRLEALSAEIRECATQRDLAFEWVDERNSIARVCYAWQGRSTGIGLGVPNGAQLLIAAA